MGLYRNGVLQQYSRIMNYANHDVTSEFFGGDESSTVADINVISVVVVPKMSLFHVDKVGVLFLHDERDYYVLRDAINKQEPL